MGDTSKTSRDRVTPSSGDMSSLLSLLSQRPPTLQTRKALILLGLQNDFISPDGKLPVGSTAFVNQLRQLVPAFRQYGDIIWVRSEFESNRPTSSPEGYGESIITGSRTHQVGRNDDELFLSQTATKPPGCIKGSYGADFAEQVKPLIQSQDMKIIKTHYSALCSTNLLMTLRTKLVTEIYLCGCLTNLSVYATAMDVARYGIKIYLIEDCLGYRKKERHDLAIKNMRELMEAESITSDRVIAHLRRPPSLHDYSDDDETESDEEEDETATSTGGYSGGPSHVPNGIIAADSDQSDDEVILPSLSSLNMRDRGRDSRYPRPLSSRLVSTASDSRPSCRPSQSHSSTCTPNSRHDAHRRKMGNTDGKLPSPATSQRSGSSGSSLHNSPSRTSPVTSTQGCRNVVPSKRDFNSMEIREGLSRSVVANAATNLTRSMPSRAQKYGYDAETQPSPPAAMSSSISSGKPLFGEDKSAESEGSRILYDVLPSDQSATIFDEINQEISWHRMLHQTGEVPRLVCCQGSFAATDGDGDDGEGVSIPVYRHPTDQTLPLHPWTPAVARVRATAEQIVGHPLNHALIQLYRGGTDYISEHSDKTLDIMPDSYIVNVSFGAQRTMRLRTKRGPPSSGQGGSRITGRRSRRSEETEETPPFPPPPPTSTAPKVPSPEPQPRTTYRIPLPHNSLLAMSLATNAAYLHGINPDRRRAAELSEAESAFSGHRISLTFRRIATFLSADERLIWGRGAVGKTRAAARPVLNGDVAEGARLVRAFGAENQGSELAWAEVYGEGFDVLHLKG